MIVVTDAFRKLFKNPVVFLPDAVYAGINFLLVYLLYSYTGFNQIMAELPADREGIIEALTIFFSTNLGQVLISGSLFIIVTFLLGVGAMALKFSLITDIINKKKPSIMRAWHKRNHFYYKIVILRVIIYLISILAIVFILATSTILYLLINPFSSVFATYFSFLVAIVLSLSILLLLKWVLLFRYPLMYLTKQSEPVKVLKNCIKYFRARPGHVIISWLIILCVSVVFILTGILLNAIYSGLTGSLTGTIAMTIGVIWTVIFTLFNLIPKLWQQIYLFDNKK
tara:strand:- start:2882 stop:3730 length:849 start_codon:yes stop_codon:yes gene_type:complete